jgi:hypothetical protein
MKTATYHDNHGTPVVVVYDETQPCRVCGLPVTEASMGGTDLCQWCDLGKYRNGEPWGSEVLFGKSGQERIKTKAREIEEEKQGMVARLAEIFKKNNDKEEKDKPPFKVEIVEKKEV